MAEIEYGGIKLGGSKLVLIIPLIGTLGGGLWAGFEFYKDYMDMKEQIQSYVAPDLSEIDKQIAIVKKDMENTVLEVQSFVDMMRELKYDVRADIVRVESIVDKIENDINVIEDKTTDLMDRNKKENRDMIDDANNRFNDKITGLEGYVKREIDTLDEDINKKLTKALDNPLANK
jgi:hypothetical protein